MTLRLKKKRRKCLIAQKTQRGNPLLSYFLQAQKFFGSVRDSNPRTPASQTSENPRYKNVSVAGFKRSHLYYGRFFSSKSADNKYMWQTPFIRFRSLTITLFSENALLKSTPLLTQKNDQQMRILRFLLRKTLFRRIYNCFWLFIFKSAFSEKVFNTKVE